MLAERPPSSRASVADDAYSRTLRAASGDRRLDPGLSRPSPSACRAQRGLLHAERAAARLARGDVAAAMADAELGVALNPGRPQAWMHKASVHEARAQAGAAARCWQAAAAIDPALGAQAAGREQDMSSALQAALGQMCSPAGQSSAEALGAAIRRVANCVVGHSAPGPSLLKGWRAVLHDGGGGMLSTTALGPLRPGEVLSRQQEFDRKSSALARVVAACAAWSHGPRLGPAKLDPRAVLEVAVMGLKAARKQYRRILRSHLTRPQRAQMSAAHAQLQLELGSALLRRAWGTKASPRACREHNVSAALATLREALATIETDAGKASVEWAAAAVRLANACHHQAGCVRYPRLRPLAMLRFLTSCRCGAVLKRHAS